MTIRLLTQQDWQLWKNLRLEALQNAPEAFDSSYEETVNQSDDEFQTNLTQTDMFGVFINNQMVGCAGFYQLNRIKMQLGECCTACTSNLSLEAKA